MLRTFNYTKRRKIPKHHVTISLVKIKTKTHFNAQVNIENLSLLPSAKVFLEAYYGPSSQRFDFGKISSIRQPENTDITDLLQISDRIYFRIKVVDEEKGLIVAFADKLTLADDDQKSRAAILYVNAVKMETNEIWRINFESDSDGTPILEINSGVENIRDIAKSDTNFQALVYPAAVRMILEKISESDNFDKYGETWHSQWIKFTEDVLGVSSTPENNEDSDKLNDWFNDVLKSFCTRNKFFEQYKS